MISLEIFGHCSKELTQEKQCGHTNTHIRTDRQTSMYFFSQYVQYLYGEYPLFWRVNTKEESDTPLAATCTETLIWSVMRDNISTHYMHVKPLSMCSLQLLVCISKYIFGYISPYSACSRPPRNQHMFKLLPHLFSKYTVKDNNKSVG